jgi:LacI family transcriptional regulator
MVTLADVAEHAGVSLATASTSPARHLARSARSCGSRSRPRQPSWVPANASAQALASGVGNVIGLIVRDLTDPYFATIADGAMLAADRHGLIVTVGTTRGDRRPEIALVAALRGSGCGPSSWPVEAGAIRTYGSRPNSTASRPRRRDRDRRPGPAGRAHGRPREPGGSRRARPGPRRPSDTNGSRSSPAPGSADRRRSGLGVRRGAGRTWAARPRRDPRVVRSDGGYAAAAEVDASVVTCVFAVNDVMAVGALAAFRDHGVVVPRDLSVAGFDDIPHLRDHVPRSPRSGCPCPTWGSGPWSWLCRAPPTRSSTSRPRW